MGRRSLHLKFDVTLPGHFTLDMDVHSRKTVSRIKRKALRMALQQIKEHLDTYIVAGDGVIVFVGQAEVHTPDARFFAHMGCPAGDLDFGFAHAVGEYFHLPPADAPFPETYSQGLGEGLLGRKPLGELKYPLLGPALTVGDFPVREDALQKSLAVAG